MLPSCVLLLVLTVPPEQLPDPLLSAFHERTSFRTFRGTYRNTIFFKNREDVRNFSVTIDAKGDILFDITGDDDGQVLPSRDGTFTMGVPSLFSGMRVVTENSAGRSWAHVGASEIVKAGMLLERDPLAGNPLTCGMRTDFADMGGPLDALLNSYQKDWQFKIDEKPPFIVVRALYPMKAPDTEEIWTIDPAKNYAVLRLEGFDLQDGRKRFFCAEAEYDLMDGRWWPNRTVLRGSGEKIVRILECTSAEFDKPNHPPLLKGVEQLAPIGVAIADMAGLCKKGHGSSFVRYIGGDRFLPDAQFNDAKEQLDLRAHREWLRKIDEESKAYPSWTMDQSGNLGIAAIAAKPDQWKIYVRRWILMHSDTGNPAVQPEYNVPDPLDEKQKEAAWNIYNDCRKRAEPLVQKRNETRKQLLAQYSMIAKNGQESERASTKKALDELDADPPMEELFEELKHRLGGILRKGQTPLRVTDKTVLKKTKTPS